MLANYIRQRVARRHGLELLDIRRASAPAALLMALLILVFIRRSVFGWTFNSFPDEAGHMLGALALHAGDTLYGTYVDAHGPTVFMLTHLYGVLSGWSDITYARSICTVLALLAGLSIVCSGALRGGLQRCLGAALFFGCLAVVWLPHYLYIDNYHAIGGMLSAVALALGVVPAWRGHAGMKAIFLAGGFLGFTAFTAYSYWPSIALFSGSLLLSIERAERRRAALWLAAGGTTATIIVLLWLARFGSITGYIAYHIVANQRDYAPYMAPMLTEFLFSFVPQTAPFSRGHMVGLFCFLAALAIAIAQALADPLAPGRRATVVLLGFAGLALLNVRGGLGFVDGAFLVAAITAVSLVLPPALASLPTRAAPALLAPSILAVGLLAAELFVRGAAISRSQVLASWPFHYLPDSQPISQEVRRIVGPNERFLALVYTPGFFLSSGRLPMAKYHEYLPWEAEYARHPWGGHVRDLCVDFSQTLPPLVSFDNWTVWDKYPPSKFMSCVLRTLAESYQRDIRFPSLYVRRDRAAALLSATPATKPSTEVRQ